MVWSNAVGPDGQVTGLESNAKYAKTAAEAIAARGITNVEIIVGLAADRSVHPKGHPNNLSPQLKP